jgi:hypothetical protein
MHDHDLLLSHTLSPTNEKAHANGAKITAAIQLLTKIEEQKDRAVLFVQYESQLADDKTALQNAGVKATVVLQLKLAVEQIAAFQRNNDTVIVLDTSDETAAGSNLQCANHAIFLSPLLRDSEYGYDSTMAQTIGRVKRHGQKNNIHVHRIFALHTIDVDILEHRERLTEAMTELGQPDISQPNAMLELDQHGTPRPQHVLNASNLSKSQGTSVCNPRAGSSGAVPTTTRWRWLAFATVTVLRVGQISAPRSSSLVLSLRTTSPRRDGEGVDFSNHGLGRSVGTGARSCCQQESSCIAWQRLCERLLWP